MKECREVGVEANVDNQSKIVMLSCKPKQLFLGENKSARFLVLLPYCQINRYYICSVVYFIREHYQLSLKFKCDEVTLEL